jgi:LacI family transcriptional regulator
VKISGKELAKICKVSIGTVDRALHDRPGINPETRELVLQAAKKYNYRPQLAARSLRTGRTMTVGVIVFDLENQFFSQLVNALVKRTREDGYFLHITLSEHDSEREVDCLQHLESLPVDGILIVPTGTGKQLTQSLRRMSIPTVSLLNKLSDSIPFVGIDDRDAMHKAFELLVAKGYERVIYFSPPLSYEGRENIYAVAERFEGYKMGVDAHGMERLVIDQKHSLDALTALARSGGRRTAVLCSSDIFALRALRHFTEAGISVPRDVGIMGFDDISLLEYIDPPLTTVSQPIDTIADIAFSTVKRLIEGDPSVPRVSLTECAIVERGSA